MSFTDLQSPRNKRLRSTTITNKKIGTKSTCGVKMGAEKFNDEIKEPTISLEQQIMNNLENDLNCPVCLEVPAIPVSLNCAGQHVVCLDCFIGLRLNTYKICQGNFRVRVELMNQHKDKCPECNANIDLGYKSPNRHYKAMLELYKTLNEEYRKTYDSYALCSCPANPSTGKPAHNHDMMNQLKCNGCSFQCPFDANCKITHNLAGNIHEANMLTKHLKDCLGSSSCFGCLAVVKNKDLQNHILEHKTWNDQMVEVSDMQAIMSLDSSILRCLDNTVQQEIQLFWTLFKTVFFRHLVDSKESKVIDPILHKIKTILELTEIGDDNKNLFEGLQTLLNTDSIMAAIRLSQNREHISDLFEDFLSGVRSVFEKTEQSFRTIVPDTNTYNTTTTEMKSEQSLLQGEHGESDELIRRLQDRYGSLRAQIRNDLLLDLENSPTDNTDIDFRELE